MANTTPIKDACGEGIGPEIMAARLRILKDAGARLDGKIGYSLARGQ